MPGIDLDVMVRKLNIDVTYHLMKQKKWSFVLECQKVIIEEVDKLVKVGFIREVTYLNWLANVVLVKKANRKWRMCIDFTDVNKAYSKDSYPLSRIDWLVNTISSHELLTFMDAFSGYNQIQMAYEDEEKTIFIIDYELFYYWVIFWD